MSDERRKINRSEKGQLYTETHRVDINQFPLCVLIDCHIKESSYTLYDCYYLPLQLQPPASSLSPSASSSSFDFSNKPTAVIIVACIMFNCTQYTIICCGTMFELQRQQTQSQRQQVRQSFLCDVYNGNLCLIHKYGYTNAISIDKLRSEYYMEREKRPGQSRRWHCRAEHEWLFLYSLILINSNRICSRAALEPIILQIFHLVVQDVSRRCRGEKEKSRANLAFIITWSVFCVITWGEYRLSL